MIPSFLLAKLYVRNSLKNSDSGFVFELKNIIDSTMIIGIGPIVVGSHEYAGRAISLTVEERTLSGDSLSMHNPIPVRLGIPVKIEVKGVKLDVGVQKISITFISSDIGKIKFEILEDNIN